MAVITTLGSGNWSSTTASAPWPSGTLPTNADVVVIANGHTVTLDVTTAVAQGCVVNVGGTLACVNNAITMLTLERDLVIDGTCTLDVSADVTKTCTIILNNANSAGTGTLTAAGNATPANNLGGSLFTRYTGIVTWKGFTRKRWTTTTGAITANVTTSFSVTDATGWQIGDRLILATTSAYNATPKVDVITIAGLAGNTITSFTGTGTGGNTCANAHASGCLIGNFSSNLLIKTSAAGRSGNVVFYNASASTAAKTINHVEFDNLATCSYSSTISPAYPFVIFGNDLTDTGWTSFASNAFYDMRGVGLVGLFLCALVTSMARSDTIFYCPSFQTTQDYTTNGVVWGNPFSYGCVMGTDTDLVVFSTPGPAVGGLVTAGTFTRPKISGCESGFFTPRLFGALTIIDPDIQSCNQAIRPYFGVINISATNSTDAKIGSTVACTDVFKLGPSGGSNVTLTDCNVQAGGTFISNGSTVPISSNLITLINKNADVTLQEIYHPYGTVKRDNSNNKRSTSSVAIKPSSTGVNTQYTVNVPCANGASIEIVGYCKADTNFYNGGGAGWTAPTVIITGPGATQTFTASAAANNAFELFDLTATNTSGADGNFTVTFTANAKSVTTGTVYFDGVPTNSPFVTKARHYGYTFDQTIPNAVVNGSVVANEATAGGYTGMTVTGGASSSPVVLGASQTFQKLYDYTQAWSCTTANLGYAVPYSGPVAGTLIAAANLTTTGYTLNGSGSISMGAFTLTSEIVAASGNTFTYTGGTYSQATTVPSFSGGTLTLGAEGTYTFTQGSSMTISVTPTADNVHYVFGSGTFSGTLTAHNTTAHPCVFEVPAGTTAAWDGVGAGTVTFTSPALYQSVTVTGLVAGSRVQIYDTTNSTELYNGTVAGTSHTWTDTNPAAGNRAIRLRIAWVSTVTAKNFIDTNIGTCGTTAGTASVSYLASQTADTTYDSNAIDGSLVTGITIAPSPARVAINIAGGAVTWPQIYAYQVYWLATATGIADEAAFISAPDTANYILTGFSIKNTNANPLTITGGWGIDSVTRGIAAIIDTAGSTGNIFPQPEHVVSYAVGSALTGPQAAQLAAIPTNPLLTNDARLNNLDTTVSSRLSTGAFLALK